MIRRGLIVVLALAACGGNNQKPPPGNGDGGVSPDASPTLSDLRFAVVGDTRPANEDDVAGYPTSIVAKIWSDVEAFSPRPAFAVSTGDYMFANPYTPAASSTVDPQLNLYLGARAAFTNAVYPAMGNHECTGATASNCGPGSKDGYTYNFTEYEKRMLQPLGITKPYFSVDFKAADGSWTAKIVVIAANAWNATQQSWLDQTLAQSTTYTFVVRHESTRSTTAPGVTPSDQIIAKHPLTLRIVGHTHTYAHYASDREIICGNGGAPLTSGNNYGYAIVERLPSAVIQVTEYDYMSNTVRDQFRVNPDGSTAP